MITVPVPLGGGRDYDVLVGAGARDELARVVAERVVGAARAAVVTQSALAGTAWFADVDPGIPFDVHVVPDGEDGKSVPTVEALCRAFARSGLGRGDVVVAVGGGIVTDVAGFAAAVYHRGTAYVNVATSLLAQVDAAVGGKTGVNIPEGKNLVGAFWQPAAVLCDTATLDTLAPREWACGRGEMAKYAFLGPGEPDASLLALPIDEQVARCVTVKADVVGVRRARGRPPDGPQLRPHARPRPRSGVVRVPAATSATARPSRSASSTPRCSPAGSVGSTPTGSRCTAASSPVSISPATSRPMPIRTCCCRTWVVTRRPTTT